MQNSPCLCFCWMWWDTCLLLQVVKFSKTFELMSPLCNMDRDIRWSTSGCSLCTWTQHLDTWTCWILTDVLVDVYLSASDYWFLIVLLATSAWRSYRVLIGWSITALLSWWPPQDCLLTSVTCVRTHALMPRCGHINLSARPVKAHSGTRHTQTHTHIVSS